MFGRALLAGGAAAALPWRARAGCRDDVGRTIRFSKLVSAEQIEQAAAQQYAQMLARGAQQGALAPDHHPQVQRLRAIAGASFPTRAVEPARRTGSWEVNLIGSQQINAFCMPGGKIAFYSGILDKLKLSDDEVAMVMGHEMAHALREHARERIAKSVATELGVGLVPACSAWAALGDMAGRHGRPAADAQIQPRRRERGRPGGPGTRRPRRLRPARRRHAVAEDGGRQQARRRSG